MVITSESERETLTGLTPNLEVDVIPNGVDTDHFAPQGGDKSPRRVVFSGKMSYYPNAQAALWFAENVFPALRNSWPDAEYIIVGNEPPAECAKLRERPGITVTGYVDDIRGYIDSSAVAVAPMQVAVGIQNKVLEAMADGAAGGGEPRRDQAVRRRLSRHHRSPRAPAIISRPCPDFSSTRTRPPESGNSAGPTPWRNTRGNRA